MARLQITIFGNTLDLRSSAEARAAVRDDLHIDSDDDAGVQASAEGEQVSAGGCGWFDSSFELRRGLDVREGLPGDARLNEWLDDFMRVSAMPDHRDGFSRLDNGTRSKGCVESDVEVEDEFKAYGIGGLALV